MINGDKQNQNNEEEEVKEEVKEEGEILRKAFEFTPSAMCTYRQRGPYIICVSCELQHAVYIGMQAVMVGTDESGRPILKKRLV